MAEKEELIDYLWKGTDRSGNRTKGEITSRNTTIARTELRKQGIRVVKIKTKPKDIVLFKPGIKPKEIAIFSRQLATMLQAGVPLVQSFDIVGRGSENPTMKELILGIKVDIESGDSLTEALGKRPIYFDELFCNLVEAGEHAGILEGMLDKIATYKEKTESLKAKIKKALVYPAAVLIVAVVVTAILLLFVVPVFEELFQSVGADLPAFTLFVLGMSEWMQEWWWLLIMMIIAFVFAFKFVSRRSRKFCHFMDRMYLALPAVGIILHKAAIARFARTLSTMSAAGVPLVDALTSVAGATGNIVYSTAVLKVREEVATGQQLQFSMRQIDLFPHMVVQMVAIGEESGDLEGMLEKVADFYEEEVDNHVDNLSSLLEPLIMVVLGVIIGGLVIAMYLPIFKLGAAF